MYALLSILILAINLVAANPSSSSAASSASANPDPCKNGELECNLGMGMKGLHPPRECVYDKPDVLDDRDLGKEDEEDEEDEEYEDDVHPHVHARAHDGSSAHAHHISARAPASSTFNHVDNFCLNWGVILEGNVHSLYAYCAVFGSPSLKPLFARASIALEICMGNHNGELVYTHTGGTKGCIFHSTANQKSWEYQCPVGTGLGPKKTISIEGRFQWQNNELQCSGNTARSTSIIPVDFACKNMTLSVDVPGVLLGQCPTNLTNEVYTTSSLNLNDCFGLDDSTGLFKPAYQGYAFEHCRNCLLIQNPARMVRNLVTNSTMHIYSLQCNCMRRNERTFPTFLTKIQQIGMHIGFHNTTYRMHCGKAQGFRMLHSDSWVNITNGATSTSSTTTVRSTTVPKCTSKPTGSSA